MSWQGVRGHEARLHALQRAAQRGRLAHAYLFVGPTGIGKRLFAQELAKALLCENPPASRLEGCDQCPACLQISAGTHPDFFIAGRPEGSLELPIEVIRELCQSFTLKSARGRGKVAILDDADDLNDAAANCFLKTLEEPPPRSVFILVGSSPERQLPTIVSRCQVVRFAPLPDATVGELLLEQGVQDPALVQRLVRLSGGSLGQALALADAALWEFRQTLIQALVSDPVDSVGLARAWVQFVEEAGKEAAEHRRRASMMLRLLIEFLNDVLHIRLGGSPRRSDAEDRQMLEVLAHRLDPEPWLEILERCLAADEQVDRRVQLVLVLEGLVDALGQKLKT